MITFSLLVANGAGIPIARLRQQETSAQLTLAGPLHCKAEAVERQLNTQLPTAGEWVHRFNQRDGGFGYHAGAQFVKFCRIKEAIRGGELEKFFFSVEHFLLKAGL